ncbi:MAG: nucleotidyltransferase domain-containing protein [bacterium]
MSCNSLSDNRRDKEAFANYIDRLKEKIRLKSIILFGSRARGKGGRRSDYDILVISDELPSDLHKRLSLLFEEKPGFIDALGFKEDEIIDIIHRHFILKAIMEGKAIYGDCSLLKKMAEDYIKERNLVPTPFGYTHLTYIAK